MTECLGRVAPKGCSLRDPGNAESLRPSAYSNGIGFYGREFIARSCKINFSTAEGLQQSSLAIHSRFTHDFSQFFSRYVYRLRPLPTFQGPRAILFRVLRMNTHDYSRLVILQHFVAMFFLGPETSKDTSNYIKDVIHVVAVFFLRSGTSNGI